MSQPPPPVAAARHGKFRPDIEGMRAIAVLLVVAYHFGMPGLTGGYIGVDVFFVVSGYLITGLLADEISAKGRLDFAEFYARRARRLLPAAALVLMSVLLVGRLCFGPFELRGLAAGTAWTSVYLSNLTFLRNATNYFAEGQSPLLHTWSLAVEEQFYLTWPAIIAMVLGKKRSLRQSLSILGALAAVSLLASLWYTRVAQPVAFFGSPLRAWEFAIGALATLTRVSTWELRLGPWLGWLGLAAVLGAAVVFDSGTPFPGTAALLPALGTLAVLRTCTPIAGSEPRALGVRPLLALAPLQQLGRLSYSWYLWHWPVLVFGKVLIGLESPMSRLLGAGLSLAMAELTYRTLENPIRRSRWLAKRPNTSILLGLGLTGSGALVALLVRAWAIGAVDNPEFAPLRTALAPDTTLVDRGCFLDYPTSKPGNNCDFGDTSLAKPSRVVYLVGDSHAAQWFPALRQAAELGHWRLRVRAKSECPFQGVDIAVPRLQRAYYECSVWRDAVASEIAAERPSAVIIANSAAYIGAATGVDLATWQRGLQQLATKLTASGAQLVVLRDTPRPGIVVPTCLERMRFAPWRTGNTCDVARALAVPSEPWQSEQQALAGIDGAQAVDLNDLFCSASICPAERAGRVVYADSNHMAASFAATLGAAVAERLRAAGL